jgi:hypothetical protein
MRNPEVEDLVLITDHEEAAEGALAPSAISELTSCEWGLKLDLRMLFDEDQELEYTMDASGLSAIDPEGDIAVDERFALALFDSDQLTRLMEREGSAAENWAFDSDHTGLDDEDEGAYGWTASFRDLEEFTGEEYWREDGTSIRSASEMPTQEDFFEEDWSEEDDDE